MNLKQYLNYLQGKESVGSFAMDSFPGMAVKRKKKKRRILISYQNEGIIILKELRAMIDLDGTIHKYSKGFQDGSIYDDPFDKAKEVIDWLKKKGYEIVIFTTRASEENAKEMGDDHIDHISKVESWLSQNGIYFDKVTAEKLPADFYIDDKAIVIKNGNWDAVKKEIEKRQ